MTELYVIILSGTKLNLDYSIVDVIDEYVLDEIYDYFMTSETDDPSIAFRKLKEEDDEITYEEICLIRLKFLSEVAN